MAVTNKLPGKRRDQADPEAKMNFLEHIEVLRWHLLRSLVAIILGAIVAFINIDFIFDRIILGPASDDFIAYEWFCKLGQLIHVDVLCMDSVQIEFQNTQLSGQFMLSFSVAFMVGFILAFPYVFWELWRFLRPALKQRELKYARGIVFWGTLLFLTGVLFAYFIIAPFTINFFGNYQLSPQFHNIITISNYYSTLSDLIIGMGIVFELPVLVYFLSKIGLLTPRLMREKRRYAIMIIVILAAVITPPDWFSIFLVAIPLVVLYELAIQVSGRINRAREKERLDW